MADDLIKRAADMLLGGATLLGQPCPYCSGVRVLKDGHALCVGCGREPERRDDVPGRGEAAAAPPPPPAATAAAPSETRSLLRETLDRKVRSLTGELERETDHGRQQEILNSLNSLLEALDKMGGAGGGGAAGGGAAGGTTTTTGTPENKK